MPLFLNAFTRPACELLPGCEYNKGKTQNVNNSLTERRRHPRWRSNGAQAYLYVRGERPHRCKVRSVSKEGLFLELDSFLNLARGLTIELAFTRSYTGQVTKLYRRSGYVTRVSHDGVAVLFFEKPKILTESERR